jgi:single-strand DNA-binding protein
MSVNKVILVGNLGKDPDLKYTPSGVGVATFSIATSKSFKNSAGEKVEKTEWHNIVAWRQLAEICGKYLRKGKQVYIEGELQSRSYDDRDGNKRYITEIVADKMHMLGSRGDSDGNSGRGEDRHSHNDPGQQEKQRGNYQYEEPPFNPDDDIPF